MSPLRQAAISRSRSPFELRHVVGRVEQELGLLVEAARIEDAELVDDGFEAFDRLAIGARAFHELHVDAELRVEAGLHAARTA